VVMMQPSLVFKDGAVTATMIVGSTQRVLKVGSSVQTCWSLKGGRRHQRHHGAGRHVSCCGGSQRRRDRHLCCRIQSLDCARP
jgi:hypothetical protein